MRDPLRLLAALFVRCRPTVLLLAGTAISGLMIFAFVEAAQLEGVMTIKGGVGFLQNYGLLSTLIGNAVLPCLAKAYYESVLNIADSSVVKRRPPIDRGLAELIKMVLLEGRYRLIVYGLIFVGLLFWLANVGFHVLSSPEVRWGHRVFDSVDHPFGFTLNRLNNLYTWMLVLPFCGHVMIMSTIQLVRTITVAIDRKALAYDLLNPDKCGGFASVERAHLLFNIVVAIVYVQIALHTGTFVRMNAEHILAYAFATMFLFFGNTIFLGGVHRRIRMLRNEALNEQKERVYKSDALSLEILKFFYEHRRSRFPLLNLATKAVAVVVPAIIKAAPSLLNSSSPFILL